MKTPLTLALEETLYAYCREKGEVVVEEVVMPDDLGIVDTLSLRLLSDKEYEWRCFELKVSKGDFRSHAKLSFAVSYTHLTLPTTSRV